MTVELGSAFQRESHAMMNPLDSMMETLRAQIVAEVKSGLSADILDRVIRIVGTSLKGLEINHTSQITVMPSLVETTPIEVNCPPPLIDVEMNNDALAQELAMTREMLQKCMTMLAAPVQRVVVRGPNNLIESITERRM